MNIRFQHQEEYPALYNLAPNHYDKSSVRHDTSFFVQDSTKKKHGYVCMHVISSQLCFVLCFLHTLYFHPSIISYNIGHY